MTSRLRLLALLGALTWSGGAFGQAPDAVNWQPWIADRALGEGVGVRAGDFELHPGLAAEFGYDSNYFQRADSQVERQSIGPVIDAFRLRITPSLTLRTLDRRAELAPGQRGAPPKLKFELAADAAFNEFFALNSADSETLNRQRRLSGGAGADLVLLPERPWSIDAHGLYRRIVEPSNFGALVGDFDRHVVNAGAGITWRPGGGLFEWRFVGYDLRATFFEDSGFESFNNLDHRLETRGRWKFLPRSALVYEGVYQFIRYTGEALAVAPPGPTVRLTDQNGGDIIRARAGYSGLITNRFGVTALGGWAASFYEDRVPPSPNFDDFIARAELQWYLNVEPRLQPGYAPVGLSTIALGYDRDYFNGYLGNFFRRDRGFVRVNYFIGGRVLTTLTGGLSHIDYPAFSLAPTPGEARFVQPGFGENRIDATFFGEYRPAPTVGINLTVRYDRNFSQVIPFSQTIPNFGDDLSFQRWSIFVGGRWFL